MEIQNPARHSQLAVGKQIWDLRGQPGWQRLYAQLEVAFWRCLQVAVVKLAGCKQLWIEVNSLSGYPHAVSRC